MAKKINIPKLLMGVALILYLSIYVYYYPQYFTFSDETQYLRISHLLSEGNLIVTNVLEAYPYLPFGQHYSPYYPIGQGLLLIPFILLGIKYIFLFGILFHLFNFLLLYKILKKLSIEPYFSLLYFVYPGILFYTRTIMTELPTIFLLLFGFYLYTEKSRKLHFFSGLLFGFSCLLRYTNLLLIIPFFIMALLRDRKKLLYLVLGFVPIGIIIILLNTSIYGGPLTIGQFVNHNVDQTSITSFIGALSKYIISLLIIFPFMFFSPFFYKGKYKGEILSLLLLSPIIFSYLNTRVFHYNFITNLIIGPRYIFPVIPFYIIAYGPFILSLLTFFQLSFIKKHLKTVLCVFAILALFVSIKISSAQYSYTLNSWHISNEIYSNTEEDSLIIGDHFSLSFLNNYPRKRYLVDYLMYNTTTIIPEFKGKIYIIYASHSSYPAILPPNSMHEKLKNDILSRFRHSIVYEKTTPFNLYIYGLKR